jgi:hypothetical protein
MDGERYSHPGAHPRTNTVASGLVCLCDCRMVGTRVVRVGRERTKCASYGGSRCRSKIFLQDLTLLIEGLLFGSTADPRL